MSQPDPDERIELLSLEPQAAEARLREFFASSSGGPPYRARQVLRALYSGATSFEALTNLKLAERTALADAFTTTPLTQADARVSADGTVKHLWSLRDGELVESVLIPAAGRTTLCISSQAGCALGCTFCATGFYGLRRNLSAAEIVAQFRESQAWAEAQALPPIGNIVFMGMGEPFANERAVLGAIGRLTDPRGMRLGSRHITISTVGIAPAIRRLPGSNGQVRLAVSLHAADDELRSELVPANRLWPLGELLGAIAEWRERTHHRPSIEWAMIRDVNDSEQQAARLAPIAFGLHAHVNLIPLNPTAGWPMQPSPPGRIVGFAGVLERAGVNVTVRDTRGRGIEAACGQLRWEHGRATSAVP